MAYLPGNLGQRIKELRTQHDLTVAQLAEKVGIDKSTLSRIENGKTQNIGAEQLISLCREFQVSADFLLGITTVPDTMNYSAEQFGLTEKAGKALLSRKVHMDMLNRLLENEQFCQLTYTLFYSTEPNRTAGAFSRNNLMGYADSLFVEHMNKSVQGNQQLMAMNRKLGSELIDPNTIGNQQMLEDFRRIIMQIRRDIQQQNPVSAPLTREFLKEMDEALLEKAEGDRKNINPRTVAEVMTDKSMVANICTPEQRARFIDLMEEILQGYGGKADGKAEQ